MPCGDSDPLRQKHCSNSNKFSLNDSYSIAMPSLFIIHVEHSSIYSLLFVFILKSSARDVLTASPMPTHDNYSSTTVLLPKHRATWFSLTRPSRFSACNIEKLGIGSGNEATDIYCSCYDINFVLYHIRSTYSWPLLSCTDPTVPTCIVCLNYDIIYTLFLMSAAAPWSTNVLAYLNITQ